MLPGSRVAARVRARRSRESRREEGWRESRGITKV
jgi:hypothetical protein